MKKEALLVRKGKKISHVNRKEILYRFTKKVGADKEELKQIFVPKDSRKEVMEVAHDTMLAGHMGVKKTEDRILTNFYCSGTYQDVMSFCRSCDVCQRKISKVPPGKMPLMDLSFKRVAVDLIGLITPASDKGHRYFGRLCNTLSRGRPPQEYQHRNSGRSAFGSVQSSWDTRRGV